MENNTITDVEMKETNDLSSLMGDVKDDNDILVRVICNYVERQGEETSAAEEFPTPTMDSKDLPVFHLGSVIDEKSTAGVFWLKRSQLMKIPAYLASLYTTSSTSSSTTEVGCTISPAVFQHVLMLMELGPCTTPFQPVRTSNFLENDMTNVPLPHTQLIENWWNQFQQLGNKHFFFQIIVDLHRLRLESYMRAMLVKIACFVRSAPLQELPGVLLDEEELRNYYQRRAICHENVQESKQ
jgi:hypothetical protein